jgi:hypothetical protein
MKEIKNFIYVCSYCGQEYHDKKKALKCEEVCLREKNAIKDLKNCESLSHFAEIINSYIPKTDFTFSHLSLDIKNSRASGSFSFKWVDYQDSVDLEFILNKLEAFHTFNYEGTGGCRGSARYQVRIDLTKFTKIKRKLPRIIKTSNQLDEQEKELVKFNQDVERKVTKELEDFIESMDKQIKDLVYKKNRIINEHIADYTKEAPKGKIKEETLNSFIKEIL